jgi:predicted RNA-binding protein YlqC (UPF0109 family)
MTTNMKTFEEILIQLIGSYTFLPEYLDVEAKEHLGSTYFRAHVHGDDFPAVVGRQGSHIKALQCFVAAVGEAAGEVYAISLSEPTMPRTRQSFDRVPFQTNYDPEPAGDLMRELLGMVGLGQHTVEIRRDTYNGGNNPLNFLFVIFVRSNDDYLKLTAPLGAVGRLDQPVLIAAIGTLFRAYGKKNGVDFKVKAERA